MYICSLMVDFLNTACHLKILTTRRTTRCWYLFSQFICNILAPEINIVFSPYRTFWYNSEINTSVLSFAIPAKTRLTAIIRRGWTATDPQSRAMSFRKYDTFQLHSDVVRSLSCLSVLLSKLATKDHTIADMTYCLLRPLVGNWKE